MYLNIKIKEDFRTLKANQEYNFDFSERGWHLIVGDNGRIILPFVTDEVNSIIRKLGLYK